MYAVTNVQYCDYTQPPKGSGGIASFRNTGSSNPPGNMIILDNDISVDVYPNPTTGIVELDLSQSTTHQLSLYSWSGERVISQNISANTSIDMSLLPAGVYILRLSGNQGKSVTKRIIKLWVRVRFAKPYRAIYHEQIYVI